MSSMTLSIAPCASVLPTEICLETANAFKFNVENPKHFLTEAAKALGELAIATHAKKNYKYTHGSSEPTFEEVTMAVKMLNQTLNKVFSDHYTINPIAPSAIHNLK